MTMDWQKFIEDLLDTGLAHGLVFDVRGVVLAQSASLHSSPAALLRIFNEFNFCGPPPRPRVLTMVVLEGVQYFHIRSTETSIQFTRADSGVGAINGYRTREVAVIGINNEKMGNDDAFALINRAGRSLEEPASAAVCPPDSFQAGFQSRNACR